MDVSKYDRKLDADKLVAKGILEWLFHKHNIQVEKLGSILGVSENFSEELEHLWQKANK